MGNLQTFRKIKMIKTKGGLEFMFALNFHKLYNICKCLLCHEQHKT